jgi:hypothetical protein
VLSIIICDSIVKTIKNREVKGRLEITGAWQLKTMGDCVVNTNVQKTWMAHFVELEWD